MKITKTLSTLSLAFAMVGGYLVFAPSQAEANGNHISNDALRRGNGFDKNHKRPGQPANPWNRGCNAWQQCRG